MPLLNSSSLKCWIFTWAVRDDWIPAAACACLQQQQVETRLKMARCMTMPMDVQCIVVMETIAQPRYGRLTSCRRVCTSAEISPALAGRWSGLPTSRPPSFHRSLRLLVPCIHPFPGNVWVTCNHANHRSYQYLLRSVPSADGNDRRVGSLWLIDVRNFPGRTANAADVSNPHTHRLACQLL